MNSTLLTPWNTYLNARKDGEDAVRWMSGVLNGINQIQQEMGDLNVQIEPISEDVKTMLAAIKRVFTSPELNNEDIGVIDKSLQNINETVYGKKQEIVSQE